MLDPLVTNGIITIILIKITVFAKTLYSLHFFQAFVPPDAKDKDYWAKREKNNIAARRSREARRLKENQIALRTAFLEKENHQLKIDLEKAKAENIDLRKEKQQLTKRLTQYESNAAT